MDKTYVNDHRVVQVTLLVVVRDCIQRFHDHDCVLGTRVRRLCRKSIVTSSNYEPQGDDWSHALGVQRRKYADDGQQIQQIEPPPTRKRRDVMMSLWSRRNVGTWRYRYVFPSAASPLDPCRSGDEGYVYVHSFKTNLRSTPRQNGGSFYRHVIRCNNAQQRNATIWGLM